MKKLNKTQGITLIALVITIIVMLILVGVTISMAINGGLFNYAGKAVGDTQNALDIEQQLADGGITIDGTYYNSIDEYLETGGKEEVVPNPNETFSEIYQETKPYEDENGNTATIPKGFAVGTSSEINTIAKGLVITDEVNAEGKSIGNEFVWIPVKVTESDEETSIASFYRSNWSNNARTTGLSTDYTEPYTDGYEGELSEYNDMLKSVYLNHGFYIGRYEAGTQNEEGEPTPRTDKANGTTKMVVKRDQYPYTYVGWGATMTDYTSEITSSDKNQGKGALYLSKAMYEGKNVGVTSTLCYGIQWDAMLDFIKDSTHNVTNSTNWGNYSNNAWTIDRATAKWTNSPSSDTTWTPVGTSKSKTSSERILLTTGASNDFASKNIYDVAGNVWERTNEAISTRYRVSCGGGCNNYGDNLPASNRNGSIPSNCSIFIGFRPALYITNNV